MNDTNESATFLIQVACVENAIWQGKVVWSEEGLTQNFDSMLELFSLIDKTMKQKNGQKQIKWNED